MDPLHFLGNPLKDIISDASLVKEIPADTEILREGQFVKVIPIVLEGLIKVFSRFDERELLLYYIQPSESCIMSFSASIKNEPSRVHAITEQDTKVLLIPVDKIPGWMNDYPQFNALFYQQYNQRYAELLDTISHLLFNKMDARLYAYLKEKTALTHANPIKISHRQIASELGTAREVVTRVMKKLEQEGKVKQLTNSIQVW
ncbi:MAG: Crp/Fnr family transcriptional regulator [Flavobacteriales bacterium]|jgi:CRP/FNR family transcriptional regulator